ncbi:MAG TPA: hypothetical protein DDX92_05910 [Flavobacteriales bacterium]|jgi:phage shock protein PspC (stress-responsive transcriptional regulator)|nr:hypothetical protein [Flavobacteriales bacterium]
MKKTVTINLAGLIFNIDEDAYAHLKNYLDTIRSYFGESEGRDEIMTDVEARIAEILQEKQKEGRQVVIMSDVHEVIEAMGQPEDYLGEEFEGESKRSGHSGSSHHQSTNRRRLFRDPDNMVVGGVCSGIGHYFGIDPIWIRLAFVVAVLTLGTGILLYIILWLIIPKAKSSLDRLEMRGEPVNLHNIGKTVEEEIDNVKKNYEDYRYGGGYDRDRDRVKNGFQRFFSFLGDIFKRLFQAIGKIFGLFLILLGAIVLTALVVGLFTSLGQVNFGWDEGATAYSTLELSSFFFDSGALMYTAIAGIVLLVGIPFLALLYSGLILLFGAPRTGRRVGITLTLAWVLGIGLTGYAALKTSADFSKPDSKVEKIPLEFTEGDTLVLNAERRKLKLLSENDGFEDFGEVFKLEGDEARLGDVKLTIEKSPTSNASLEIIRSARGRHFEEAMARAENIDYQIEWRANQLILDREFTIPIDDKWRDQEVEIVLLIPENHTVYLASGLEGMLQGVKNYTRTKSWRMLNHHWTMTDSGLVSEEILYNLRDQIDDANRLYEEIEILEQEEEEIVPDNTEQGEELSQ